MDCIVALTDAQVAVISSVVDDMNSVPSAIQTTVPEFIQKLIVDNIKNWEASQRETTVKAMFDNIAKKTPEEQVSILASLDLSISGKPLK